MNKWNFFIYLINVLKNILSLICFLKHIIIYNFKVKNSREYMICFKLSYRYVHVGGKIVKNFSPIMSRECQPIHAWNNNDENHQSRLRMLFMVSICEFHRPCTAVHCYLGINNTSNTPIFDIPISEGWISIQYMLIDEQTSSYRCEKMGKHLPFNFFTNPRHDKDENCTVISILSEIFYNINR